MITVEEIKRKAERLYPEVLRSAVRGESLFPIEIRANKKLSSDFTSMSRELNPLIAASKDRKGYGYSVHYEQVKTRNQGIQGRPTSIVFDTLEDYLQFTGKRRQYQAFLVDVYLILAKFPYLKAWVVQHHGYVLEQHGQWADLLTVCEWFLQNYEPNRYYIRELPIPVHTKFIEEHKGVIRKLLDELVPHLSNSKETEFEKRFGLKYAQPCIRFRILDDELFISGMLDDVTIPQKTFATLNVPCQNIFVVENRMNFLTFPKLSASITIWGKGFALEGLKNIEWLASKNIIYWSDIDIQGFQMLSQLRSYYPQTQSMLMDFRTLTNYSDYVVNGTSSKCQNLPNLAIDEKAVFDHLNNNNLRLEQERISQADIYQFLNMQFFSRQEIG